MPEPAQRHNEQIAALQAENDTLKRTNVELVAKHSKDKARIAELESATTDLQGKLTDANKAILDATVGAPLKAMAESMSSVPNTWMEQFGKIARIELQDGKLTVVSVADSKPLTGKDGKAIPFEREALAKFLTEGTDERAKTFQAITIAHRASGAATPNPIPHRVSAPPKHLQFGLR